MVAIDPNDAVCATIQTNNRPRSSYNIFYSLERKHMIDALQNQRQNIERAPLTLDDILAEKNQIKIKRKHRKRKKPRSY
jgi:hypothetical protein